MYDILLIINEKIERNVMSLQFILGPGRSGKTTYLYDELIKESIRYKEQNFFLLVPDQSTLNAQKELVTRHPFHGTMNIDVVGFFRLAYRIFEELSYVPKDLLEDEGKSMIIRKVMEKRKKDLKVFASSMKKPGFIEEMKSFLAEMYQYDISKDKITEVTKQMSHPGLQAKMDDILIIMKDFEKEIQDRYLISEQLFDVLAEKMIFSEKIKDAIFYVDGFTGFTPIQRKVIKKLLQIGKEVKITLTAEKETFYRPYKDYELFAMSKMEKHMLVQMAQELGVEVKKDIFCTPDTRDSKELRFLERNLFHYPYNIWKEKCQDLYVFQAVNPRMESRHVAVCIEQLVREKKYRYKDIVCLSADLSEYESELERSFQDLDIPYFVDSNRRLQNNPCIETILAALKMIQADFSYDMVFRYLKSGFSCLSNEDADLLENYVIALGIRGYAKWNQPFESKVFSEEEIKKIEANRQIFMEEIKDLKEGMKKRGQNVIFKLTCLYRFLERLGIEEKMQKRQKVFEEKGDLAQAKTYEQIYDQVIDLLEQMADILGEEKLSYDDFLSVLESGMEEMTVGVIPPSFDQVLIGDMERTRAEGVKVLFFLGVNEGMIPKQSAKNGVISDYQKELLKEKGISMAPTSKTQIYQEQYYLYLAVAKPSDLLFLSYSQMGANGESRQPSYFLDRILRIFPAARIEEECTREIGYTKKEAMEELTQLLGEEKLSDKDFEWLQVLYFSLCGQQQAERLLDAKFYENRTTPLSRDLVRKLYGDVLCGSVTRMEQFAGCAFSHFMQYGLKLRERIAHEILPMDMGKVFHKTMELVGKQTDWKFADDKSRDAFVDQMVENAITQVQQEILNSTNRNHYLLDRMKRISKRAVWVMEQYIRRGEFTPEEYEIAFSEENHLDSMHFILDDGGEMIFSGVVDRMDSMEDEENKYLKIIDYKSGNIKFDFAKIFHGLQMQLIIYMNAMMELYEKKGGKRVLPAGMFYFHMDDPTVEAQTEEDAKMRLLKEMKMSGVVNEDFDLIEKIEDPGNEGYLSMPVRATKNGFDKRSSILNTNQMLKLGATVEEKMKELGNALMKGDVSIRPYEYKGTMPCTYCSFRNICAFEEGRDPARKIKSMSLEEGKHALDEGTTESH